jgi:iron complex outermembrane receptor protein
MLFPRCIGIVCLCYGITTQAADFVDEQDTLFTELPSVFTASRHLQPVTNAPASVDIISANQIRRYGWRTLGAIINSLPGFLNTYERAYQHVGVRGFAPPGDYNTRVLLLIDGHRVNENLQDYAGMGRDFLIDVENIDRVEVVRGPGSALYGSSAFFAVINVITQRGRDLQGVQLAGELASFDSHRGQVRLGKKFSNGLETLITGSFYHSDGHERLTFPGVGTAQNLDEEQVERLFNKTTWGDFTLSGGLMQRKKFIPTGFTSVTFNEPGTFFRDRRAYADLNYHHFFQGDWEVTGRLFWDRYQFNDELHILNAATNVDTWHGEWFGGEVLVSHTFFERLRLTIGSEYRRNYLQRMNNHDISPFTQYADNRLHSSVYAGYLHTELELLDNLHLNAGFRYNYSDSYGDTMNPRVALVYSPWQQTTLKLLYGTAFRAPSTYEMFYNCCANSFIGNPDLQPETIDTYEFIWEQHLNPYLDFRLSHFYNQIKNLISQTGNTVQQFKNSGGATAYGIESLLQFHFQDIEGKLSYTYLHSQTDTSNPAPNAATHMLKFNLSAPLIQEKLFAGVEVHYISDRLAKAGGPSIDDYTVTNLSITSQNWLPGLKIDGGLYNLFDSHYSDPATPDQIPDTIPQDGRNLRIRISYEF